MKRSRSGKAGQGYAIGYGKPPSHSRFQAGRSGNPAGRPRRPAASERPTGLIQLDDIVIQEALRPIQLRENDQIVEMPMIRAVMRSLGVAAVKGHHRSQLAIANMVRDIQSATVNTQIEAIFTAWDYKKHWHEIFEDHDRRGLARPEPIPHPHEIVIDERALTISYNGPSTLDEKARWDNMLEAKKNMEEERGQLEQDLKKSRKYKAFIQADIDHNTKIIRMIAATIPDKEVRRKPGFDINKWRDRQPAFQEAVARQRARRRRPT